MFGLTGWRDRMIADLEECLASSKRAHNISIENSLRIEAAYKDKFAKLETECLFLRAFKDNIQNQVEKFDERE